MSERAQPNTLWKDSSGSDIPQAGLSTDPNATDDNKVATEEYVADQVGAVTKESIGLGNVTNDAQVAKDGSIPMTGALDMAGNLILLGADLGSGITDYGTGNSLYFTTDSLALGAIHLSTDEDYNWIDLVSQFAETRRGWKGAVVPTVTINNVTGNLSITTTGSYWRIATGMKSDGTSELRLFSVTAGYGNSYQRIITNAGDYDGWIVAQLTNTIVGFPGDTLSGTTKLKIPVGETMTVTFDDTGVWRRTA